MELPGFTEKVPAYGSVPVAKFGHCCCMISPNRLIVFGGASGNVNSFAITNDTFCLEMASDPLTLTWRKLESNFGMTKMSGPHRSLELPQPAPALRRKRCSSSEVLSDVDYFLKPAGRFAPADLYQMVYQGDKAAWSEVEVVGEKPRERYGHTLTYTHPNLILFGGNTDRQTVNDSWCLNTGKQPFQWIKLQINGKMPAARVYHSAALCQHKAATGMIVIFGGRNAANVSLQDTWGRTALIQV